MADDSGDSRRCSNCGELLTETDSPKDGELQLCWKCVVEKLDNDYVKEKGRSGLEAGGGKSRTWKIVISGIILLFIFTAILQAPRLTTIFKDDKPIRAGTYSTDRLADQCIKNLWHISSLLQKDKVTFSDYFCPASKKPYVIITTDENMIVSCPNPGLHNLTGLSVSKKSPVPKVNNETD